MPLDLEQIWIEIDCPNCQYGFEVQMIDAKLQNTIICNNCKSNIQLVDQTASVQTSLNSINHSFKELENIFKKFK
jgi:peptide subunit release factor 1 (eRF1)